MTFIKHNDFHKLAILALVTLVALVTGCGSDDPTGPSAPAESTHFEVTVKMSSIWAQEDCENTPGNPGEFRYRLIVRTPDTFGNNVIIEDTGNQNLTIDDGVRMGVNMDPIQFLVPRDPDATFQVEYWIGEYDGADADFLNHSWATHRFERGTDQKWAAGTRYEDDRYTENSDGSGSGLYKFSVWNTRNECKGAAYYYVTWTPVTP